MPSTPSAPPAPDPQKVAAAQLDYNDKAQQSNLVNQEGPYGSLKYTKTIDPVTGRPIYTANNQLNNQQQQILDTNSGIKLQANNQAGQLLNNVGDLYTTKHDFSNEAGGLTKNLLDKEVGYLDPVFTRQKDYLDNKLINQGLTPDSPAYKAQMQNLQRNQNDSVTHFLATTEPQAFDQVVREYNIPMQTASNLYHIGSPNSNQLVDTSAARTSPVNYGDIANQGFQNQMAGYNASVGANNNMMTGIGNIAGSALGTAVLGPVGGAIGGQLGSAAAGMFGSQPSSYGSWQAGTTLG